jgi:beta-lactamase class D
MTAEQSDSYRLRGKTGWSGSNGWFVGYLQTDNTLWLFAHPMIIRSAADLALRKR